MAHHSGPPRNNPGGQREQQPPPPPPLPPSLTPLPQSFEIVLDDSCAIICDDVPVNCTIRVTPVDGRSPPRLSPVSQWMRENDIDHCCPPPPPQGPPPGPLPMRSRRSIVDSVRRNIHENSSWTIHSNGDEEEVFCFRRRNPSPPNRGWQRERERERGGPENVRVSPSYSSSPPLPLPRPPPPPPSPPPNPAAAGPMDRLVDSNRPQRAFRRDNNLMVDDREIHSDSTSSPPFSPPPASPSFSSTSADKSSRGQQWHSPPSPPPSKTGGDRCCAMADYNHPSTSSGGGGGEGVPIPMPVPMPVPVRVGEGRECSYHGLQPCPVRAGSRCRANLNSGQKGGGAEDGSGSLSPGLRGMRSCRYHEALPCPVLAGVHCRAEIQMCGSSGPPSPSATASSPNFPEPQPPLPSDATAAFTTARAQSPGRSREGAKPPRYIPPPPRSPRSRSPVRMPDRNKIS